MCMCTLIYLNSQSSAVNKVSSSRRIPESSSSQYQVLKFKKKPTEQTSFFNIIYLANLVNTCHTAK